MTNNGSSEGADPLVGQVLAGGLRVLARVGSTSEGPLYRAQYLQTGPPVALTVLRLPASMSAYSVEAVETHGVLTPGAAFLQKPFTIPELTELLRAALDQEVD